MMGRLRSASGRDPAGMTLIEVMLALAIFATLIALTWGSMTSSFRVRTAAMENADQYRLAQNALERMAREISMAFVTNIGDPPTNDRSEVTYRTIFEGERDELTFTSFAHVRTRAGEVATDQVALSYRVERQRGFDGRLTPNLVRRAKTPIDARPERGGIKYALLEDIHSVTFEYWDDSREIAGNAWTRSWNAARDHEGRLPSRVRISVEMPHPHIRNATVRYSTQTRIHLQDPILIVPAELMERLQRASDAELEQLDAGEGGTQQRQPLRSPVRPVQGGLR